MRVSGTEQTCACQARSLQLRAGMSKAAAEYRAVPGSSHSGRHGPSRAALGGARGAEPCPGTEPAARVSSIPSPARRERAATRPRHPTRMWQIHH